MHSLLCVHELFEAQAARSPDAIAVSFGPTTKDGGPDSAFASRPSSIVHLTYGELDRRANQLARILRTLGVGPEAPVAVCLERSPELIVALLAVLKAGGSYVPIDPSYPAERLAFMLADSGARALVTKDIRCPAGPQTNDESSPLSFVLRHSSLVALQVVDVCSDWPAIAQESSQTLGQRATPQSAAYVIYTSGSTGRPKGVAIEHRALLSLIAWHQGAFDLSAADRATLLASPSFDASVWELWPYLSAGASVHIPAAEIRATPARLRDWLIAGSISICFLPTPLAENMLALAWPPATPLRAMLTGGDQLRRFPSPDLPFALVNNYGPTENAVVTTSGLVAPGFSDAAMPDIGRPIVHSEVYILDAQMQPAPPGSEGELYIGGSGLARGYLNRPDLTAARFVPNPFGTMNDEDRTMNEPDSSFIVQRSSFGARLYRTGDLARYRPDGTIAFLGRIDGQVKLRGFRIELGEIEAALRRRPGVQEALVMAREDAPGERRIVAYVVTSKELRVTSSAGACPDASHSSLVTRHSSLASELRAFLAQSLPAHMIPSAFVALDTLPLTPNGKIDRRALPAPGAARPDLGSAFVAPRSAAEALVADAWARALGIDQVGVHDNFFELGGDSLRAIQIVAQLGETFHIDLSPGALFAQPSVAGMAANLDGRMGTDAANRLARAALERAAPGAATPDEPYARLLIPSPPRAPYYFPLSFGQQQLWIHAQMAAHLPVYNEPFTIRMGEPIQVAALKRSFQALVQRHEMLRASVVEQGGHTVQLIQPQAAAPLRVVDLRALPPTEREAAALRLATTEARRPFDLARGPLLRATLAQLATADNRLFITAHHISVDGVSLGVLLQDLAALYQAAAHGRPALLPDPQRFAGFVRWQRDWFTEERRAAQLAYWRAQLAGLPILDMPTDHPRPALASFHGARRRFELAQPLTAALKSLSRRAEVSLFVTLFAAFQALLAAYTGQDDIVAGTVSAGRSRPEFASLVGYLVNTLALRTDLSGDPTFQDLLRRVQAVAVGAMDHQDAPFAEVVQAAGPERAQGISPLFQVAFVLEPPAPAVDAGWSLSQLDVDSGTTKWDVAMHLEERPEGLVGRVQYNADLFDPPTIARLIGRYRSILAGVVADPSLHIADLPILSAAERQQLLHEWNDTQRGVKSQESGVRISYPVADPGVRSPGSGVSTIHPVSDLLASDSWLLNAGDKCIHQLFEAQAARAPDAVALVFSGAASRVPAQHLTYRALDQRANRLAHHLRRLGVGPEVRVGLSLDRSLDMIIGLLGILKAGGAYVPLDPAYPRERLDFMLADSGARALVTKDERRAASDARVATSSASLAGERRGGAFVPGPSSLVDLRADARAVAQQPNTSPESGATADNLAYLIYTSGSTGRPKGVMLEHRGLCNLVTVMGARLAISPASRVLQFASLGFDASVWDIFVVLTSGASLHLASADTLLPGGGLLQLLRDQAISVATLPPSVLALLPPNELPALGTVISAGESCSVEIAARWSAGRTFINAYGPSEATVCSTLSLIDRRARDATHVPIGRPLPNIQIYLLDRHRRPAPIGVAGEIHIGGVQLARGYLNRPDLTAERFVPNPFTQASGIGGQGSDPDLRLYRTGDLARFRPDGQLEFLGRIGQQVKLRGFRIELGEIETALSQHPAIRDAAVLAREDRPGDRRLVAYVVTSDERTSPDISDSSLVTRHSSLASELRAFLAQSLPAYMIPSAFVALDALPLTPNGKVDRRALPAPATARSAYAADAAPRTPMERTIAAIWRDVLGVDAVGLHDAFFDLGGHSLLISQVYTRLREVCDHDLALVDLFTYPTIHSLASYLGRQPERLVTTPKPAADYQLTLGPQRLQQLRARKRA